MMMNVRRSSGRLVALMVVLLSSWSMVKADGLEAVLGGDGKRWEGHEQSPAVVGVTVKEKQGLRFAGEFAKADGRLYWDAGNLQMDVSKVASIKLTVYVENAANLSYVNLYLRSGNGWFVGDSSEVVEGWNTLSVVPGSMRKEGNPDGLDKVQGMRFSLWGANVGPASVTVCGVKLQQEKVAVDAQNVPLPPKPVLPSGTSRLGRTTRGAITLGLRVPTNCRRERGGRSWTRSQRYEGICA